MQFCRDCNTLMVGVMSFSKDRHEKFSRCPKCYGETKHKIINQNDLKFDECLHNEFKKYKK